MNKGGGLFALTSKEDHGISFGAEFLGSFLSRFSLPQLLTSYEVCSCVSNIAAPTNKKFRSSQICPRPAMFHVQSWHLEETFRATDELPSLQESI
jgi:hypothetical protein